MKLMESERIWPKVGQKLVHRFRKTGEVVAKVVSVDRKAEKVTVQIGGKVYSSLSTAAKSITKKPVDGWTYWGLKKQEYHKKRRR